MDTPRRRAAEDAHVIDGTVDDEGRGNALRVTIIATGLLSARHQERRTRSLPVLTRQPPRMPRHVPCNASTGLPLLDTPVSVTGGAPLGTQAAAESMRWSAKASTRSRDLSVSFFCHRFATAETTPITSRHRSTGTLARSVLQAHFRWRPWLPLAALIDCVDQVAQRNRGSVGSRESTGPLRSAARLW